MKRVALFLLALIGLPVLWALGWTFLVGLSAGTVNGAIVTPSRLAFFAGGLLFIPYYLWKGRAWSVIYVFAHEMTHAVVGLFFFAKIHRINVRETGGFVELSKSNVIITLAPYCVPFYLLISLVVCAVADRYFPGVVPPLLWSGLFGFLTLFHILYTIDALVSVEQPDVLEYGRLFSYWFILSINLLCAILALSLVGIVPFAAQSRTLANETRRAYGTVYSTLSSVCQTICRSSTGGE